MGEVIGSSINGKFTKIASLHNTNFENTIFLLGPQWGLKERSNFFEYIQECDDNIYHLSKLYS